jgi:hypothetical protein
MNASEETKMKSGPLTLSQLSVMTKAPPRMLQHWTEVEIIKAKPKTLGRGFHRTFDPREARVAAIAASLGGFGMSIPMLKDVIDYVRPIVGAGKKADPSVLPAMVALNAGRRVFLLIRPAGRGVEVGFHISEGGDEKIVLKDLFRGGGFVGIVDMKSVLADVS